MGVYIKGMEMPKSCYSCPLRKRNGIDIVCPVAQERFSVADVNILFYRLNSCPLVPVPPHGDLIDRDAILKKCEFVCTDNDEDIRAVRYSIIENAPTVIPENEEGET